MRVIVLRKATLLRSLFCNACWMPLHVEAPILQLGRLLALILLLLARLTVMLAFWVGFSGVRSAVLKVLDPHRKIDTTGILSAKKCAVTLGAQLVSTARVSPNWSGHFPHFLNQVKAYVRLCWLKTISGGWCKIHRMHEDVMRPCIFGCPDSEDDLQHHLICPVLWQLTLPSAGMIESIFNGEHLCICDPTPQFAGCMQSLSCMMSIILEKEFQMSQCQQFPCVGLF